MLPTFLSSLPNTHILVLSPHFPHSDSFFSHFTLYDFCNDTVAISVVDMNSAISPNPTGDRIVRHSEYYIHGGDVIFRVRAP